jgi:hypothetical protein
MRVMVAPRLHGGIGWTADSLRKERDVNREKDAARRRRLAQKSGRRAA